MKKKKKILIPHLSSIHKTFFSSLFHLCNGKRECILTLRVVSPKQSVLSMQYNTLSC